MQPPEGEQQTPAEPTDAPAAPDDWLAAVQRSVEAPQLPEPEPEPELAPEPEVEPEVDLAPEPVMSAPPPSADNGLPPGYFHAAGDDPDDAAVEPEKSFSEQLGDRVSATAHAVSAAVKPR